ncbi:MAG: hypothetical protein HW382_1262, partial [Deltaproteobacteria bacterium]|nr:hypothetical protein [Deltaproteobacteria bacterium]
ICIKLAPPTIDDPVADLERLKRELSVVGFSTDHFHCGLPILRKLGKILRDEGWDVTVTLYQSGTALELLDIEPKDKCGIRYGAAVDIGTTSVVVYLVNLITGEIIDTAASYNAQARCGDDVISRIVYATEMDGLDELQRLVVDNINHLLTGIAKKHAIDINLIDKTTTLKGVWEQRKRWGSKTVYYNRATTLFLGGVFIYYFLILMGFIFSPLIALGAFCFKTLLDFILAFKGMRLFGRTLL